MTVFGLVAAMAGAAVLGGVALLSVLAAHVRGLDRGREQFADSE